MNRLFAKKATAAVLGAACAGAFATQLSTRKSGFSTAFAAENAGFDPNAFAPATIAQINRKDDLNLLSFATPEQTEVWNPKAFTYFLFKANIDGKNVIRPYTPIADGRTGLASFYIKAYKEGTMSRYIGQLQAGQQVEIKGPLPKYPITEEIAKGKSTFIVGGTGVTPALQFIQTVSATGPVQVVFASNDEKEIALIKPLILAARVYNPQITGVIHRGLLTPEAIKAFVKPEDYQEGKGKVFVCGPPGFMQAISGPKGPNYTQGPLEGCLKEFGLTENEVVKL